MEKELSEWPNEAGSDDIAFPVDERPVRRPRLNQHAHDTERLQPYHPPTVGPLSSPMFSGQMEDDWQANPSLVDSAYHPYLFGQAANYIIGQLPDRSIDGTSSSLPSVENTGWSTAALTNEFPGNFTGWTSPSNITCYSNATQNPYLLPEPQFGTAGDMLSPVPQQQLHSIPLKRAWETARSDVSAEGRTAKRPRKLSLSALIRPTQEQELELQRQLNKWEEADHFPTETELRALATLTKLKLYKVALWFGGRLRIASEPFGDSISGATFTTDRVILADIKDDIKKANSSHCASGQSKKAIGGKYRCTWGCGYSTDLRNAWQRHEEVKQPQNFWHCIACRASKREVFIAHRPDKFLPHADACHPDEDRDHLRARSEVHYRAPFLRRCTYTWTDSRRTCDHQFVDWKERNKHWIRHFDEEAQGHGPSTPNDSDGGSDEDGSNNDQDWPHANQKYQDFPSNQPSGNSFGYQSNTDQCHGGSGGYGTSFGTTLSALQKPSVCSFAAHYRRGPQSQHSEVCLNTNGQPADLNEELAAKWLIHVRDYRIVEAKRNLSYIALGYSPEQGPSTACLEAASALPPPSLPSANRLPSLFRTALRLARETGFEYIWIDVLCGLRKDRGGASSVYQQAKLILAMGPRYHDRAKTWHFFCDHSHLRIVKFFGDHGLSFQHLKQLGHGAYSVVDKVQLHPALDTLARKTVFRTDSKLTLAACWMQEIRIMQKLKHPHITRFVAAYHDQRAFNILMWPVGECDMRHFLACPDQFPDKRQYLPTWFMSLAEALAFVHKMQCRHKDIKPANILIKGSNVLLTDFGTSTDFSTSVSTSTGGALMTPKYCAPEVAAKGKRGRSADVFSLGCVFAEMITVDLGLSLEEMHRKLRMEQNSHDHCATYHNRLPELKRWLEGLGALASDAQQEQVLHTTVAMLAKQPSCRPRASSITRVLCSEKHCTGLRQGATCHCCPRRPTIAPVGTQVQQTALHPVPQKSARAAWWPITTGKELLSLSYRTPAWSFTGELRKDYVGKYDFTFSLQSQGCLSNHAFFRCMDHDARPPITKVPGESNKPCELMSSQKGSTQMR